MHGGLPCEGFAPSPGGHDVCAEVAERGEPLLALDRTEAGDAPPGGVLEEDALDRILGAEGEDLVRGGIRQHPVNYRNRVSACRFT